MRIAVTCTDCGFENPRAWVTCARCGALLGPRLRRATGSGVVPDSQTTATTLRAAEAAAAPASASPTEPAASAEGDGDADGDDNDEKTRVYAVPASPAPPAFAEVSTAAPASEPPADAATAPIPVAGAGQAPSGAIDSAETARPPVTPSDARPLLGQEAALAQLQRAIQTAFDAARVTLVVLHGAPGAGRTLMLHRASELAARLRADVAVHYAALRSRDDGPYAPFSRLLLERFGIAPASSPAAVRSAMESAVADVLDPSARIVETTHMLGHIAGVPFPDSAFLRTLEADPDALREQAVAAAARFTAGEAGRRPVLFLLDDMADADDGAYDVLSALAELAVPLAIVAAGLPEIVARTAGLRERSGERISVAELVPLAAGEAGQLVRAMVPDLNELPEELLSALMHRSGGNPRQLVELVRALQDGGLFQRSERGDVFVDMSRLEGGGLPLTMADTIRARFATLEPGEQQVMRDAAVIGERFWDGALLALARARALPEPPGVALDVFAPAQDEQALQAALDELEAKGFIARIADANAPGLREYTFEYAGTRSLLYADLSEAERIAGHTLAARWLSVTTALSVESVPTLRAPHLEHAGAREAAAAAYLQAAGDERARMRTTMALRYVDKTLALTDARDTSLRIEALHQRGSLLATLGRYEEALTAFGEIVKLAWTLGARGRGAAALNRIARIHRDRSEHDEALEHLRAAIGLFKAIGDQRGLASSYDDMAQVHRMRAELTQALAAAKEALQIRVQLQDRRAQAVSLNTMGRIELDQGMFDSAQARFTTALKIRESLSDHEGAVQTRIALGQLAFRRGRTDEAVRTYLGALEAAREMNNRRFQSYTLSFLGEAYLANGELDRADAALREAKRLATALRDQNALATIDRTFAQLSARRL
jgi:tetratricopeptide (TPR) repeat protein